MYVTAVVLAAGASSRMRSALPKPLIKLSGRPLIAYSLKTLADNPLVKEIIIAVNPLSRKRILRLVAAYKIPKVSSVVLGGRRRQDSLRAALRKINSRSGIVLVHDAARPFLSIGMINRALRAARHIGAAVVGVPVKATVKLVSGRRSPVAGLRIEKTLDRKRLWEIQTPQVFRRELLVEAYRKFGRQDVTDDAMLVEKLKHPVAVAAGSYENIKITTPEDLVIAEALLKNRRKAS